MAVAMIYRIPRKKMWVDTPFVVCQCGHTCESTNIFDNDLDNTWFVVLRCPICKHEYKLSDLTASLERRVFLGMIGLEIVWI